MAIFMKMSSFFINYTDYNKSQTASVHSRFRSGSALFSVSVLASEEFNICSTLLLIKTSEVWMHSVFCRFLLPHLSYEGITLEHDAVIVEKGDGIMISLNNIIL